ncbi:MULTISPECIES: histidine phosphatase family protein [Pseudomonas fluorescens group]|uniref:Ais_1 protein n=1 Tax=Pseudomonas fluorescens TaxID=294 RepID=A0A0D0RVJ4_PSEFL|nr:MULTISPECIES: histidine phosphatase family protein [Pseudomonas fluorescens group]AZE62665.1 Ais protein, putative [Pseudomonas synxantha]KIR23587.1 Lipopolysaccharide core heptose(II)-phosphate phosphatase precursor [Pseudomonas fluorescens]
MINISLSKTILSAGFIGAAFFAYEAFTRSTVENLDSNKKLTDSGLSEDWKSGNVILLIRHEERCDRSNNPCLGPDNGITVSGSERAKEAGIRLKTYFKLDNTDIFTSPMTRTVQTSDVMLGKASLLSDREAICGSDIIDKLLKHKTANKNLIVVTHNTCMKDLIRTSGHKHSWSPEYGSLLFAKTTSKHEIQIVGKLNPDDFPKHPPQI